MSVKRMDTDVSSFEVTVRSVIGQVTVSPYGDGESPAVAAFRLIAENDTPGVYEFPILGTDVITQVTVEHISQEGMSRLPGER